MKKLYIVSNRLPVSIKSVEDKIDLKPSIGGLATGMKSIYKTHSGKWIGWSGIYKEDESKETIKKVETALDNENCVPVYLDKKDIDLYYYGFSNRTVWPLFHYFAQYTEFITEQWESYKRVNEQFADRILKMAKKGDTVWVHDYHLLLLPKLLKDANPDLHIGFFLHIPFPSYEVFRILPWRTEIIEGMLGADLIGFHTYDYERHFLSCVRRLLGNDINFNQIKLDKRIAKVDAFPMGIDYDRFYDAAIANRSKSVKERSTIQQEIDKYLMAEPNRKLILSIDRLDYSKGISNRLLAFEHFLDKYPEYRGKASLVMLCVPSRSNVPQYQIMKSEVDELVGRINGKFASIDWTPVWYFYRSMPFENLIELYENSEIALITPIRDGMNLVAKEYLATKIDGKGTLILSEMTGAAKELGEAIMINPNNMDEIADSIKLAFEMPVEEQKERNLKMQERLKRYNVERWASDFIESLEKVVKMQEKFLTKRITKDIEDAMVKDYKKAKKRILFLDYDGTLVGFKGNPKEARPDEKLYNQLDKIASQENTELVLISGRDKETFTQWFGDRDYTLIVEHGVWIRQRGKDWEMIEQLSNEWKEIIRPTIEFYVDRTPGTFIEEKNYSLVWHYRKADPELGLLRSLELKDEITSLIANHDLEILEGNKVIEIKKSGINKGRSAMHYMDGKDFDFMLGAGDDWTDEYLFEELPKKAVTIKVGLVNTQARFNYQWYKDILKLLDKFADAK